MKKIVNPLCETMIENPKCHLHIPQPRKGSVEHHHPKHLGKKNEKKKPQRNTQNPNALVRVH
jgi:hypothetical protein